MVVQRSGGDVADEIVVEQQRRDVHLVVLGLWRRSPVGEVSVGSVAQRALLDCTCDALAVEAGQHRRSLRRRVDLTVQPAQVAGTSSV